MNFQNLTKAEPNGIQVYLADESITSEAAADAATAGQTHMLKNGNILMDDTILNSYTYQGRWVANGGGSSGDKITDWISGKLTKLTADDLDGMVTLRSGALYYRTLTKLELPESLKSISDGAIQDCIITEFITGDGLETISADGNDVQINKINIGKKLQSAVCFARSGIKDITISAENPYLIYQNGIVFDKNITAIMFVKNNIETASIPSTVKSIPDYAFSYNDALASVSINGSIDDMGEWIFGGCENLEQVNISGNFSEITNYMFTNCSSLATINLPASLTNIGDAAFRRCTSLQQIDIPANVTKITSSQYDSGAFDRCTSLRTIICRAMTPPTIVSRYALGESLSLEHIYVPSGQVSSYKAASGWSNYSSIIEAIPGEVQ